MARIAAKATRGRGKKCPKGQTCASNPGTRKHRNKVAKLIHGAQQNSDSRKFECSAKSGLTRDVLEKFDAIQLQKQRKLVDDNEKSSVNQSNPSVENWLQEKCSVKTSNSSSSENENGDGIFVNDPNEDVFSIGNISAASIWSNCTNVSFDKFLNGFDPKSKIHKAMLTILATIRDAIDQQSGSETDTEYFSGLMLTLNCVDSEEKLTATIALIQMVLKRVPTSVLRLKFSETSSMLIKILSQQLILANPNGYLTKSIINALQTLLQNQELAVWELRSTQQIFETILMLVIHGKPRIRKAASFAVISLVCNDGTGDVCDEADGGSKKAVINSGACVASKLTAEFCIRKLEEHLSTTNDEHLNIVLYILSLLSDIMSFFPSINYTKQANEAILSHMTLGNVLLVTGALHTFYSFFLRRPKSTVLSKELNARILNALYDYQPNINDDQPLNAWCAAVKEALLSLHNLDSGLFLLHVSKFLKTSIACLQSDSQAVHSNICNSIKSIMHVVASTTEQEQTGSYKDLLSKLYSELETSLKYQYSQAWTSVIPILSDLFIEDAKLNDRFGSIMQRLAIIYESNDPKVNKLVEQFFSRIIRSKGPRFVLNYCPIVWKTYDSNLKQTTNDAEFRGEFTNAWLLPIIRENVVDHSELILFVDHFLPIADQLSKKASLCGKLISKVKESSENVDNMQVDGVQDSINQAQESLTIMFKELNRCVHALWSLLPAFCMNPIDVAQVFPRVAKRLGETLYDKDLAIYPLAALRNLLKCNDSVQQVVGRFAKNFLPILFNVYTNENENTRIDQGLRFPVLVLIQLFVPLLFVDQSPASLDVFRTFWDKLQSRLKESSCSIFRKHALLDVLRAFLLSPKGFTLVDINNIYHQIALPLINHHDDDECRSPTDQKKGFRLIEEIVMSEQQVCREFLAANLQKIISYLIQLMQDPKAIKSPSARAFALRIINRIISKCLIHMRDQSLINLKSLEEILPLVLNNLVVKATKTKKCAREMLITITEAYERLDNDPLCHRKIVTMIIDPLKQNPQIDHLEKQARLDALAFLFVQKYHHPNVDKDTVSSIADAILLSCLSNSDILPPTRAMLNICFEFIRHFFNNSPSDLFNSYLEVIACGITNLPEEHRTKFYNTIKIILSKLSRRFGFELIQSMIPEDYQKVLKNIRKLEERKKRKSKNDNSMVVDDDDDDDFDRKSMRSRKSGRSQYLDFSDDDEDDVEKFVNEEFQYSDEDADEEVKSKKNLATKSKLDIASRMSNNSIKNYIREEIDGDPIDLLSFDSNKNVFSKIPTKYRQGNFDGMSNITKESKNKLPIAEDGRLNLGKLLDQLEGPSRGQKRAIEQPEVDDSNSENDSEDDHFENKSYKPGGKGIHRPVSVHNQQRSIDGSRSIVSRGSKKSSKSSNKSSKSTVALGDVYQSKKASGDMKRKGMPDPYAYYPLDAMTLNKRKALKNRGQFKAIIKGARKGVSKAKHLRNKRLRSK